MRNIINLNKDWKFIQKDAGLPNSLPTDWTSVIFRIHGMRWTVTTETEALTAEHTGMQRHLRRQNRHLAETVYLLRSLQQDSRRRYMSTEQKLCIMRADIPHSAPTLQISAKRMARIFWSLPAVMSEKRACIRSLQTSRFTEGCTAA